MPHLVNLNSWKDNVSTAFSDVTCFWIHWIWRRKGWRFNNTKNLDKCWEPLFNWRGHFGLRLRTFYPHSSTRGLKAMWLHNFAPWKEIPSNFSTRLEFVTIASRSELLCYLCRGGRSLYQRNHTYCSLMVWFSNNVSRAILVSINTINLVILSDKS